MAGGVGAIPGAAAGAATGAEVGFIILEWMGLVFLAKYLIDHIDEVAHVMKRAVETAWSAGQNGRSREDDIDLAAHDMARAVAVLLRLVIQAVVMALLALSVAGTAGFHFIEGWSWFDSFYMVVITLSTIGYQEVHQLSHGGRVFNSVLIIAGVAMVFLMVGALTQALLEFELVKVFGKRRMEREVAHLKNHYIICGAGRVGNSVARELARKPCPFLVIESDEKSAAELDPKWLVMAGDAASDARLIPGLTATGPATRTAAPPSLRRSASKGSSADTPGTGSGSAGPASAAACLRPSAV